LRLACVIGACLGLATLGFVPAHAAEAHVVKKGETLSSIARSHGVSVRQLIEANALSRSGHVKVGQRLTIPKSGPTRPEPPTARAPRPEPALAPALRRALDRAAVTPGRWDYIVVHHSATSMGSAKAMDRYHREERHMENGLAYHFVIGNGNGMGDGTVTIGHRWTRQLNGGHLASEELNTRALGICLVGNFDQQRPTAKQLEALDLLTEYLMKRCGVPKSGVKTHQQINPIGTRCPGRLFDDDAFLRGLKEAR
jgi:LysM repeat protein